MYQFIDYEKNLNEHLAVITMNRPEVLNAMNPASTKEMTTIWDDFANDPEMWVAILTGAGDRAFTVGNDLKDTSSDTWPPKRDPSGWGGLVNRFDLSKPVIAAVNGWALGGGFELCLAADLVIASESARFGCPEVRIGGVPTGSIHRLIRQVPSKAAMAILLTGESIDAQEAFRIGLINEVVTTEKLMIKARELAKEITRSAPLGVQAVKKVIRQSDHLTLSEAMQTNYPAIEEVRSSQDSVEGRKAFTEKRRPKWEGR